MNTNRRKPAVAGCHAAVLGLVLLLQAGVSHAQVPASAYSYSRASSFTYYTSTDSAALAGLIKTETVEPDNPQLCVTTSYSYDGYGNKTGATTANCASAAGVAVFTTRTSTTAYAAVSGQIISGGPSGGVAIPGGTFVTTATNALSQSETHTYDPRFGAALTLTGPNALKTTWQVDDFGRKVKELRADGTSTLSYYCYINGPSTSSNTSGCPTPASGEAPADAVMFVQTVPYDAQATPAKMGPFVRVYSDRLGRQLRSVTESFDGAMQTSGKSGVLLAQDTVYNDYGAKIIQTQPYFLVSGSSTTAGSSDLGATLTTYDALGRPTDIYSADSQGSQASIAFGSYGSRKASLTHVDYAALQTTTTNDKGQTRVEEKNGIGEVFRVTDNSSAQIAYQHDAFGNLEVTKDALQNTVTLTYDIRGHKASMADPDTGLWKYQYDALGELVWQQSPNERAASLAAAQQTTMAYDVLGRMTQRVDPEYTSTWSYDKYIGGGACAKGIGKLCESSTTNGVDRKIAYDTLGRSLTSRTTVTSGPTLGSAVVYDTNTGRVSKQVYPTGLQVGYSYTTRGYLEKLTLLTASTVAPLPATPGGAAVAGESLTAGAVLWQAQVVDAWGKAEKQGYGNGVVGSAAFEAATGRTSSLTAVYGSTAVMNYAYTWDSLNNLTERDDAVGSGSGAVTENFAYSDSLNRLTQYQVSGPSMPGLTRTVNLTYNALGMLLYKSDVGNYTYPAQGGARPHALQSVAGAFAGSYGYDANGNQITAAGGKYSGIAYTSFNLPDSQTGVSGGATSYTWQYDENHARIKEVRSTPSGVYAGTVTTWDLHPDNQGGLGFEMETNAPTSPSTANPAVTSNRHYLSAGGQAIGVLVSTGALPTLGAWPAGPTALTTGMTLMKVEYWHKDHLGSLLATTDHLGNVTQRFAFDPFGKRRMTAGTYDSEGTLVYDWSPAVNYGGNRGFTGHEQLDDVGLIHMNGRVFDPTLGVFLQGDPMVQDPFNLQNYNRYGYCYNNPMGCSDPSGFCFLGCFWQPKHWGTAGRLLAVIAISYFLGPEIQFWAANAAIDGGIVSTASGAMAFGNFVSAATTGFLSGALNGGNLEGALQGAFTAGSFDLAGDFLNAQGVFAGGSNFGETGPVAILVHGVVGCATSAASGGKCGPGALSAAFSQAALPLKSANPVAAAIESAVIGGTASALGGGKFANGAETGAFGYLFNELLHEGSPVDAMRRSGYSETYYPDDGSYCNIQGRPACGAPGSGYSGSGYGSDLGSSVALGIAAAVFVPGAIEVDAVMFGLRAFGLEESAASFGARTLLADPNWKQSAMLAISNESTQLMVSLDGLAGEGVEAQVMSAVRQGMTNAATPTNWEIYQLYQSGRLGQTILTKAGQVVHNPF